MYHEKLNINSNITSISKLVKHVFAPHASDQRTTFVTEFTKIYERLDIADLIDRGESFYQNLMGDVVNIMEEKGKIVV